MPMWLPIINSLLRQGTPIRPSENWQNTCFAAARPAQETARPIFKTLLPSDESLNRLSLR